MKRRRFTVCLVVVAQYACAATAPLSPSAIRAAVDDAAKQYLGDFPADVVVRTVVNDASRFMLPAPPFELRVSWVQSSGIPPHMPDGLLGAVRVFSDSAEGAYFVFLPAAEATLYPRYIIAARVTLPDWSDWGGDG